MYMALEYLTVNGLIPRVGAIGEPFTAGNLFCKALYYTPLTRNELRLVLHRCIYFYQSPKDYFIKWSVCLEPFFYKIVSLP